MSKVAVSINGLAGGRSLGRQFVQNVNPFMGIEEREKESGSGFGA